MSFREQPDGERLQTGRYEYLPEQPAERENKWHTIVGTVVFHSRSGRERPIQRMSAGMIGLHFQRKVS